jgi:hypothetical protein
MRAIEARNAKAGYKKVAMWQPKTKSLGDKVSAAVFEYNTAESVMLASAILVCLSGLMFNSTLFTYVLVSV